MNDSMMDWSDVRVFLAISCGGVWETNDAGVMKQGGSLSKQAGEARTSSSRCQLQLPPEARSKLPLRLAT